MKLFVESQETGSRWELEIDADKQAVMDLLDSDEWMENIESEFLSEDWNRKGRGFEVFGLEDEEITEIVNEIKAFFEDQGLDVEDVVYKSDNLYADNESDAKVFEEEDNEEEFEEEDEDLYEDYFSDEDEDEDY